MLQVIEANAVHYGLKLNRSKCEAKVLGEDGAATRSDDGTSMSHSDAAKYLGCSIYASGDTGKELGRRLGDAART